MRTASLALLLVLVVGSLHAADSPEPYADLVREDAPVAWWRFDAVDGNPEARLFNSTADAAALAGVKRGTVKVGDAGPRPGEYPTFESSNAALVLDRRGYVVVADPGETSPLDFTAGDAITLEAWVRPESIGDGQTPYLVGKGRTKNMGFAADNQNYGLRLVGKSGKAGLSFLFRTSANRPGVREDWHRWDSVPAFAPDGRWHHVAVTYEFGKPNSIHGYVDGKPVKGTWDTGYGGTTESGPVVDDDELWIGSAIGGQSGSSLNGGIDEVAIYRKPLSAERIALRYVAKPPQPYVRREPLPEGRVLVELFERVGESSDAVPTVPPATTYTAEAFGFTALPVTYDARGLRADPRAPWLIRATARITLPAVRGQLLVRTRGDARLSIDGEEVLHSPKLVLSGNAHGHIIRVAKVEEEHLHPVWAGDNEHLVTFEGDGKPHLFELKMIVGEKNRRPEPGETLIAFRGETFPFELLTPGDAAIPLTHDGWYAYAQGAAAELHDWNREQRRGKSVAERAYWEQRHERVRDIVSARPAIEVPADVLPKSTHNAIDRFVNAKLAEQGLAPHDLVDDWAFLRRVTVDVIGTVPTEEQIASFLADESPDRRANYVDRLLAHPGWADNWVGYWQDVLAENPNVLKPTLNNTGPFRFWLHEVFEDNRPFDRFATELITMRGSRYYGGPNGFEMASQNDVPMAAKAHVVAQGFLGLQMKCARCHDAPFRDFEQRQLFQLAAMLNRGPQAVPQSSSVPGSKEELENLIIKVSLEPGSSVQPDWPFPDLAPADLVGEFVRDPKDSRERLATLVTSPANGRFARVIVNRVWARYTGRGFVDPVDDWSHTEPAHAKLLDWLAREFVLSGYDLKHLARLILTSHTYQRRPVDPASVKFGEPFLFAGPLRRRMSAEQIVDSMFVAAGKDLQAGELNFDVDGERPGTQFVNLGRPSRAWQFASLSNERDRPSLSLPFAQDFVDHLETFGWRSARQDPLTDRDTEPTAVQPAMMANGLVTGRVTRLSDDAELTDVVLAEQPLDDLVARLTQRVLTRPPTSEERELFALLLEPGYENRAIDVDPTSILRHPPRPQLVSWSNHLDPEANAIKIDLEKRVRAGDPPSVRLETDWRQRAEDVVWALVNSPEFVFLP
jgi:hypothetical protein